MKMEIQIVVIPRMRGEEEGAIVVVDGGVM